MKPEIKGHWRRHLDIVWNLAFLGCAIAAVLSGQQWLGFLVVGFVWSMLFLYLAVYLSDTRPQYQRKMPCWFSIALDVAVFGLFIYGQWYITAATYAVSCVVLDMLTKVSALDQLQG